MENILFKIAFPAEFHAQTAVEAAFALHSQVVGRLDEIERIELETQEPGVRIIDKQGPLNNYADRDHCLQYMVAIGLIFGDLTADHYSDETAADPRIDALREKMVVSENESFTSDYYDLEKRAIGNAIKVFFNDGSCSERVEVQYPVGHRVRRAEGLPIMVEKFNNATRELYDVEAAQRVIELFSQGAVLDEMPVADFMQALVRPGRALDSMLA